MRHKCKIYIYGEKIAACLKQVYKPVHQCKVHIHFPDSSPGVAMKKVYLEKRSLAEHNNTTVDLGDLEDLDLFLHNELENYINTTSGFVGQAVTSSHMQPVHSAVPGDHRPSVIVENAKDEVGVPMLLDPTYDIRLCDFDLVQTSDLASPSDSSPLLSSPSTSTCHMRTSSPPPSHQESSPANSPTPGQVSHTSTKHSTSSPSTSRSKTGRKPHSLSTEAERKVYPCQHSGCSKKYTKLSHLKVILSLINKMLWSISLFPRPTCALTLGKSHTAVLGLSVTSSFLGLMN